MDFQLALDRPEADFTEIADDEAPIDIGARVRSLRHERKWTLTQTAKFTGLSLSALSKIERNELSPTLSSLSKIAKGFGIEVVNLLSDNERPFAVGRRSLNRHAHGLQVATTTCQNTWLAADLKHKRMLPMKSRVVAKHPDEYSEWPSHAGELFVYVLSGCLVIHSQLYAPLRLEPGDSLYYDARAGHKWTSEGVDEAVVLWVYVD
ncbi:helix-turn-helix domain-containing protein [Pseudomonas sp. UBA4194]|jgi:transcriptional regulator with XRE-family HTH domain|uniref:helix-turn-helix domain-containing protein n=1 Tax=Pseudomonas sp. UBA4194 TaxID=1947317 RepID=UPI0025EACC8D|nr:XRE family transcriptional regulator [Pseudomonas sp. UBA4194]